MNSHLVGRLRAAECTRRAAANWWRPRLQKIAEGCAPRAKLVRACKLFLQTPKANTLHNAAQFTCRLEGILNARCELVRAVSELDDVQRQLGCWRPPHARSHGDALVAPVERPRVEAHELLEDHRHASRRPLRRPSTGGTLPLRCHDTRRPLESLEHRDYGLPLVLPDLQEIAKRLHA